MEQLNNVFKVSQNWDLNLDCIHVYESKYMILYFLSPNSSNKEKYG